MATDPGPVDVSAIVAAHNAGEFIGDAVSSVLEQTYDSVECIVVDDGSSDNTAEVVGRFGSDVHLIRQSNQGVSATRNAGVAAARGRYVAFLDADDAWLPHKIELQMDRARSGDFGLIFGDYFEADVLLRPVRRVGVPDADRALENSLTLVAPGINVSQTGFVPKDVFEDVGGFDPRLSVSADLDLGLRIAVRYRVSIIDQPLALYRRHGIQMSDDYGRMEVDMKRVLAKFFAQPDIPGSMRDLEGTAHANLYLILAGGHLSSRHFLQVLRSLALAVRCQPRTAVAGAARRISKRIGLS